ncbi:MAG: GNAT family N-acetyltransferase [Anaerolineae bacterium]|nr:GNAT family N-acetyltransferase [Anaerolineae bacterium]MDQ7036933.1 GNAT family N-acetyltransferase [Anaerolineae bacterium]
MPLIITLTHEADALQTLRDEWNDLQGRSVARGAALSWTWINVWWQHFHDLGELWLMEARRSEDNRLVGIAPMMRIQVNPRVGLGWQQIEFIGSSHFHEHLDFIIEPDYEMQVISLFIEKLKQHRNRWDILRLARLSDTPTLSFLESSEESWQVNEKQVMISPYIQLPADIDAWMSSVSKNRRKKQRRYLRYLNETYPDNWSITQVTDPTHLDKVFDELVELHQAKWDDTDKSGAFYQYGDLRAYFRDLMHALLQDGCLRLYQMVVDGETVVVLFSYYYQGRTYDQVSGVHDISADVPVGHVMTQHSIAQAIADGADEYTFMWGTEPYKYSFGAKDRIQHAFDLVNSKRVQFHKKTAQFLRGIKSRVREVSAGDDDK